MVELPPAPEAPPRSNAWMVMVIAGFSVFVAVVVTILVVVHDRGSQLATTPPTPAASGASGIVTDRDGGFSITFPGPAPTAIVTQITGADGTRPDTLYQMPAGFAVSWTRFPNSVDLSHPDVKLQSAMAGEVAALKGTISTPAVSLTVEGAPAVQFTVAVHGAFVRTMLVLRGHVLYTIEAVSSGGDVATFAPFAAGFKFLS